VAVYAIGDVQGCYDPFRRLLDTIRFDPADDTLWLTGDLVNRGPKSLKTLRFVRELDDAVVSVLGNHDLHLLALHSGAVRQGNRFRSLRKLLAAPDVDELCDWLRHRPLVHYDEGLDTLLVHAGTHPRWSVRKALKRAAEVEAALQADGYWELLGKMYGNTPHKWSSKLDGYRRMRFIINAHVDRQRGPGTQLQRFALSGAQEPHPMVRGRGTCVERHAHRVRSLVCARPDRAT
jgi:bis(5'-nucleosyl)-tetraphosphatase (symmetrical)